MSFPIFRRAPRVDSLGVYAVCQCCAGWSTPLIASLTLTGRPRAALRRPAAYASAIASGVMPARSSRVSCALASGVAIVAPSLVVADNGQSLSLTDFAAHQRKRLAVTHPELFAI